MKCRMRVSGGDRADSAAWRLSLALPSINDCKTRGLSFEHEKVARGIIIALELVVCMQQNVVNSVRGKPGLNVVLWLVVIILHELYRAELSEAILWKKMGLFKRLFSCPYQCSYMIKMQVNCNDSVFMCCLMALVFIYVSTPKRL